MLGRRARSRCAQQRSVVILLHDLDLAARHCDFLIAMKDGRIVSSEPLGAVITPETLRDVFEVEGAVVHDPGSGLPVVIPERSWLSPYERPATAAMPMPGLIDPGHGAYA